MYYNLLEVCPDRNLCANSFSGWLSILQTSHLTWTFWICQFEDVSAAVMLNAFVSDHPGYWGEMIGSYKLLHTSNSMVKGQYLNGKNFGWFKIPYKSVNEAVLVVSPAAIPT